MRIIQLMGGGDVGGAKTHIMSLVKALGERHEVMLVSFREGPFAEEAKEEGIRVEVLPTINLVRVRQQLLALVDQFHPDVIHCHGSRANLMGALIRAKRRIPIVTTVHSDYKLDYLGAPLKQHTLGNMNAIALRFLDYYQPVADRMAQTLIRRGFNPERLFVIYNGMDFSEKVTNFDRAAYCREKWGIEIDEKDILCGIAARLTAVKDIGTLLRALQIALREAPQLRLFIAGEGEDGEMLKKLAHSLGIESRVVFCGWVNPIDRFYAAMDLTVLSSLSETFPYSVLEGIREGCAAICSDVGGMSELIDTGENGYIYQPRDVEQLAKYLVRLANDDEMRHQFAARLLEKASREFSMEHMCRRQEENYTRIIERFRRPVSAKDGIVICGAYGKGNAGDDAILKAIVQEMRALDRDRPIWVMSRRPKETRLVYRTGAIYTFNFPAVLRRFRQAALYINGGGNLMQDVTSTRSLQYYLYTLSAAKRLGCAVMMYGCGIGPIERPYNRKRTTKVLNQSVDLITLRDDLSQGELERMCITKPVVRGSADTTIILTPASREVTDLAMESCGIPADGQYIGFGLRSWRGLDAVIGEIAAAANYAYEQHGLIPVFVPIEFPSDLIPAERVAALLRCPHYLITTRQPIEVTIGILARMKAVVGIRLHSLMFSAGQGVPVIGLSYDPKVDGFLEFIGSRTCIPLSEATREKICPLIDECVSGALDARVQRMAKLLTERESQNSKGAQELLHQIAAKYGKGAAQREK